MLLLLLVVTVDVARHVRYEDIHGKVLIPVRSPCQPGKLVVCRLPALELRYCCDKLTFKKSERVSVWMMMLCVRGSSLYDFFLAHHHEERPP